MVVYEILAQKYAAAVCFLQVEEITQLPFRYLRKEVRKTAIYAHFLDKNDHFAKTGSG
jgi:hypothetical protein